MTFASFIEIYREVMSIKIRENTWQTKNAIINSLILPYFGDMPLDRITSYDVLKWKNKVMSYRKTR